jgi:xanthine dehydrogenase YagR molybdenum-binding subunit
MTIRNLGQPFVRRDGRAKVTGAARYSHEVAVPEAAYGVLVTSGIAKGRIVPDRSARSARSQLGSVAP